MTPRFEEVNVLEDANDIKGLKRRMFGEMEWLDSVGKEIKRAERYLSIEEPDSWHAESYQKDIDKAKAKAAQYQEKIDTWQKRIDAAEAY